MVTVIMSRAPNANHNDRCIVVEGTNTAIITVTVIVRCRGRQHSDH
ncbi:MAG: hypothetical protein ACRC0O_06295 [Vibrio metschnikovii]